LSQFRRTVFNILIADKRVSESSERTVDRCQCIRYIRHRQEHYTGGTFTIQSYIYHMPKINLHRTDTPKLGRGCYRGKPEKCFTP